MFDIFEYKLTKPDLFQEILALLTWYWDNQFIDAAASSETWITGCASIREEHHTFFRKWYLFRVQAWNMMLEAVA